MEAEKSTERGAAKGLSEDKINAQDTFTDNMGGSNSTSNFNLSPKDVKKKYVCPVHDYIDDGMKRIEGKVDTIDNKVDDISLQLAKDTGYQEGKFNFKGWVFNNLSRIVNAVLIFIVIGVIAYFTVL